MTTNSDVEIIRAISKDLHTAASGWMIPESDKFRERASQGFAIADRMEAAEPSDMGHAAKLWMTRAHKLEKTLAAVHVAISEPTPSIDAENQADGASLEPVAWAFRTGAGEILNTSHVLGYLSVSVSCYEEGCEIVPLYTKPFPASAPSGKQQRTTGGGSMDDDIPFAQIDWRLV